MIDTFEKNPVLEEYIKSSMQAVEVATQFHIDTWSIERCNYWNIDQQQEKIYFYFNSDTVGIEISAPVQVVGIYTLDNSTFTWAWDNPQVEPNLQQAAKAVQNFAKQHAYTELLKQSLICSDIRAWQYTSIAMRLFNYTGAYSAKYSDDSLMFMIFNNITVRQFELTDI
ncbi:DUF6882 domain-containing protein [Entomomonas asaccharolytica]|uniref:Uncharacterized protein n=1 Tax=Entomomonas asaccharolytica TaxID=2785331 RepID=A0A974NGX4_9GAMM|nr:DUF6882 domain-containing protein [Entomomonas asaccharolytica]QQP86380.1 hypothetical protein JHT90_03820 [Entomomonas asaccharolytica]